MGSGLLCLADSNIIFYENTTLTTGWRLLESNVRASRIRQKMALGKNLPTLVVGAGYMYANLMDKSHPFAIGFVSLSVPVSGWWGGSHAVKRQKLQVRNAENMLADNSELLVIAMQKAWADLQDAYKQILIARNSIEQSAENLRLNEDRYHAGTTTMSDLLVQISAVILATYVTFFIAEGLLHVSGVIALVAFGLTLTYVGKPRLKPEANRFMENFWELAGYIANTLIFILVGVVIAMRVDISWTGLLACVCIYIGINVIRLFVIFLFYPLMKRCGYGLTIRECILLGWGGLRGALGLILALVVSICPGIPDEIRKQVLFYTAAIVTLTLLLNATTVRRLLNRLGMSCAQSAKRVIDYKLHEKERKSTLLYFEKLHRREILAGADWEYLSSFLPLKRLDMTEPANPDILSAIRIRLLNKEKQLASQLCASGTISIYTLRNLTVSTDILFDHDGQMPLDERKSIAHRFNGPLYIRLFRSTPSVRKWIDQRLHSWVISAFDLGRGFLIVQKEEYRTLDELTASNTFSDAERERIQAIFHEIQENISRMEHLTETLREDFPVSFRHALTDKALRMLLCERRRTWTHFADMGLITEKELSDQLDEISHQPRPDSVIKQLMNLIRKESTHIGKET